MAVITVNISRGRQAILFSEQKKMSDQLTEEKIELLKNTNYSKKAIDFYIKKINVGVIENADVALKYIGPCGDTCKIYLKINDHKLIEEAKFQYLGCLASAACGSIVTQLVKKKTLQEAEEITEKDILEKLGGLPDDECHCATLVLTTLPNAIKKYETCKK